jgi:3-deoxy-manno-octulosonate cytidylyltransferase (CMP-KDO synthetase)
LAVSAESYARPAVLGVIPARLGSERLPRKPLQPLAGRPLVEWVWRRARSFHVLDAVVIATDSDEVLDACQAFGARGVRTASTHPSGTDRVAEVAAQAEFSAFGIIVNVQGDEPFVTEAQVAGAVERVRAGWDVGTVAAAIEDPAEWTDESVVKVVLGDAGGALYFSRSPVPHFRGRAPSASDLASIPALRHIGVYAYSRKALERWVTLPVSRLEQAERLEQLRPLAAGLGIGVAVVDGSHGGVDTPEDLRRAEARLMLESAEPSIEGPSETRGVG